MRRIIALAAGLAAALYAAPAAVQQNDRGILQSFIEDRLSEAGREVRIEGFQGALSSRAQIAELTIADEDGVWLRIEDAVLDWNRSALLRGRLSVNELAAGLVRLDRLPEGGSDVPQAEAQGFSLPELPVAVMIDGIDVDRVFLGEPVVGQQIEASVEGRLQLQGGEGQADLQVVRVDGRDDRLTLQGSYENESEDLALLFDLQEAQGGIVSGLLNLPGQPQLELLVDGEGTLSDFAADIALSTEGAERLSGQVTLAAQPVDGADRPARRFSADVSGDIAPIFTEAYRPFFGDRVALNAAGQLAPDGRVVVDTLDLQARALSLTGEAAIGAGGLPERIALQGRIGSEGGGPVLLPVGEEVRVDAVRLDIGFDRSQGEDWTGEVAVVGLSQPGLNAERITLQGAGRIAQPADGPAEVTADLDFAAQALDLAASEAEEALGQEITGAARIAWSESQPVILERLAIDGETYGLTAEGRIGGPGEDLPVEGRAEVAARDLSSFAGIADRPLAGAADLSLEGSGAVLAGTFDVLVRGQTRDLQIGDPRFDPLLVGTADISLAADRDETGTRIELLTIDAPDIEAVATAALGSGQGAVDLSAEVADLAPLADGLAGPGTVRVVAAEDAEGWDVNAEIDSAAATLNAEGRVGGLDEAPFFDGRLGLDAADLAPFGELAGRPLGGGAELSVEGRAQLDATAFDLAVDGRTTDLVTGIERLDPLLAGTTLLEGQAAREGTEFAVRDLDLSGDQVQASGTAIYDPGATRLDLTARLTDLGLVLEGAGGPATADIEAVEAGGGYDFDVAVESQPATIDAEGRVADLETTPVVSGRADIRAEDLSLFADLAGRDLTGRVEANAEGRAVLDLSSFDVAAEGTAQDLAVGIDRLDPLLAGDAAFDLDAAFEDGIVALDRFRLTTNEVTAEGEGRLGVEGEAGGLTIEAEIARLGLVLPQVEGPGTLRAELNEIGGALDVDARLQTPPATVAVDGRVTDPGRTGRFDGRIAVDAETLAPFGDLVGREIAGGVDLQAEGVVGFDGRSFDLAVDGRTQDLAVGVPQLDPLIAGTATLAADAAFADGLLAIDGFSLETPELDASAEGRLALDGREADVTFDARIADLGLVAPGADGPATLDAALEAVAGGLSVDAALASPTATVDLTGLVTEPSAAGLFDGVIEIDVDSLAPFGALAGRDLAGSVQGALAGEAALNGRRFDLVATLEARDVATGIERVDPLLAGVVGLTADASLSDDVLSIDEFRLASDALTAEAQGRLGLSGETGGVTLSAEIAELGQILPGASGAAQLRAAIDALGDAFAVDADLTGALGGLSVEGRIPDPHGAPAFEGDVTLDGLSLSPASAFAGRPVSGRVSGTASGRARLDGSTFDLDVDASGQSIAVGIGQVDRILAGTTRLSAGASRADGTIRIEGANLAAPQLSVQADGRLGEAGTEVTFDARLADLGLFVPQLPGAATASGTVAQAQPGTLRLDVDATGPGGLTATVSGTAAQDVSTVSLDVDGSAPLAIVNPFIAPRAAAGTAQIDLSVEGPPGLSSLSGQVATSGAEVVAPNRGVAVQGIEGAVDLSGGTAQIDLAGGVEAGGNVAVSGPITLSGGFPAELAIDLTNAVIQDPALYETRAGGTVTIVGPLTGGATIGGQIALGETELRIPSTGFGSNASLEDIIHINEPADVRVTRQRAGLIDENGNGNGGGGGRAYPLDLTILAEDRIFIRGRGLDAELGGRLALGGTTANVIPAGRFELIRGRLDILGQRITLDEGAVSLQGEFLPVVSLTARTEAQDVLIRVVVEGPANDPEIRFESEPQLPEDEVLAQLLFGRSIDSLSPLQAAELASAVATLAGTGGQGIIGNLREQFGLDDLDVTTGEDGNLALRAGTYISENVYTDVTVGAEGTAEINLNLDVTQSLTVKGSADSEGDTSVGIFFERDY